MKFFWQRFFGASVVARQANRSPRRGRRSRPGAEVSCERLEGRTLLSVNPTGGGDHPVAVPLSAPVHDARPEVVLALTRGTRLMAAAQPTVVPRATLSAPDVVDRGKDAVFTITLSQPAAKEVSVAYTTRDLRGRAGVDYTATKGTLTFAAGETSKTVNVPTLATSPANARAVNFQLLLSSPSGLKLANNIVTTRIVDPLPPAPSGSNFQITVTFPDNSLTLSQQRVFTLAAQRWSQIIVGDLPEVAYDGRVIDDLEISASAPDLDGVGGLLGQAGYTQLRTTGAKLPYLGAMQFDSSDVSSMMGDGTFLSVVLHEMGHVLGIGSLWRAKNLVTGIGTTNPTYTGTKGLAEYNKLLRFGGATSVPVENLGGAGTYGAHWRESVFGAELMTGYAEGDGKAMPVSRMTVGSLEDLGYTVDYAKADPYTLSAAAGGTGIVAPNSPPAGSGGRWIVTGSLSAELAAAAVAANPGGATAKPRTAARPLA